MKDLTKGNIYKTFFFFGLPLVLSGLLTQTYSVIDTAIAGHFLGEKALAAMGAIISTIPVGVVGAFTGMSYDDYLDYRFKQLMRAQKLKDTDSVTDLLDRIAEDMDTQVAKCPKDSPLYPVVVAIADKAHTNAEASKVLDIVVDAYGIGKDLKDTHDLIYGKEYTLGEFVETFEGEDGYPRILEITDGNNGPILRAKSSPAETFKTIMSGRTGIPLSGWDDPSKFDGNVFKVAGTLWSYGEKLLPDPQTGQVDIVGLEDVRISKIKEVGFLEDVFDFVRDLDDLVSPDPAVELSGGGGSRGIGGSTQSYTGRPEIGNRGEQIWKITSVSQRRMRKRFMSAAARIRN